MGDDNAIDVGLETTDGTPASALNEVATPEHVPEKRLSYTIDDDGRTFTGFTEFINALRDNLARRGTDQEAEDICDGCEDADLSSCKNHPLLAKPRADQQPERWLHIKLQAEENKKTSSVTLVMREDNVDIRGFINQNEVRYELGYRQMLPPHPNSSVLHCWGNSYKSILAARNEEEVMDKLKSENLGESFATEAVSVLSCYDPSVANGDENCKARRALVGLMFIITESAKMNHVCDAIAGGWDTGKGFTEKLMTDYVSKYMVMSWRLRHWKRRNYAKPQPDSELRAIHLVLNVCVRWWELMRIGRCWLAARPLLLRGRQRMGVVLPSSCPSAPRILHRVDRPLSGDASSSSGALPRVDGDPTPVQPSGILRALLVLAAVALDDSIRTALSF